MTGVGRRIVLLEPARAQGFVSGGYRYQDEVCRHLAARGEATQAAIAGPALATTVAALRRHRPDAAIVVDGLFVAQTGQPLPAGVIALLHEAPATAAWAEEPLAAIATSAPTAAAVRSAARAVAIVRPGLDACFVPPAPPRRRANRLRIACVGTIRPAKGQLLLVESLAALPAPRPDIEVVLLGDERTCPDHAACVRAAAGGVPLRWLGCLRPDQVASELQRADLLVSASRQESFGMAVAEAAACGTPVLAFDTGEIRSFVRDGRNGWLVDARADATVFAAALAQLLGDPSALAAATLAAERPALGDWPTVAQEFLRACQG